MNEKGEWPSVVPAISGGAGHPELLQELSRSGGLHLAACFCAAVSAPGSTEQSPGPELQAITFGRHLSLPVQHGPPAGIRPGVADLDNQTDPR